MSASSLALRTALFCMLTLSVGTVYAGVGVTPPYVNNTMLLPGSVYAQEINAVSSAVTYDQWVHPVKSAAIANDWITYDPAPPFRIPAGQTKATFKAVVNVPQDAAPGNYTGRITLKFNTDPNVPSGGGAVVDVNLTVVTTPVVSLSIRRYYSLPDTVGRTPIATCFDVQNDGNTAGSYSRVELAVRTYGGAPVGTFGADILTTVPAFTRMPVCVDVPNTLSPGTPSSYIANLRIFNGEVLAANAELSLYLMPNPNTLPVARAGADRTLRAGPGDVADVTLDGSTSSDANGPIAAWAWSQQGTTFATTPTATVTLSPGVHTFRLRVTDGSGESTTDDVTITVTPYNLAPIAVAGEDVVIAESADGFVSVTLDGSNSSDPDGDLLMYAWLLDGEPVASEPTTTLDLEPGVYLATLIVDDGRGGMASDEVLIEVLDVPCGGPCDDQIACTVDSCDALTDTCQHVPVGCITDRDGDGLADSADNCPDLANDQADFDGDSLGDACDDDDDNDGVPDSSDRCPFVIDPLQANTDGDSLGDACDPDIDNDGFANLTDNCPLVANEDQDDLDEDGAGDTCDTDDDNDGTSDVDDVCPRLADSDQLDTDGDGAGDTCDADLDGDGVDNETDNCPTLANPDQQDLDLDEAGNACDSDDDNDGAPDDTDNCRLTHNPDQLDTDLDLVGNACDSNDDGDLWPDSNDNCPLTAQADQADGDSDGAGDACDDDRDGDTVTNGVDNCPDDHNGDQTDTDGDRAGDACDGDDDGDGVEDLIDNCPLLVNDQADLDTDGIGDACDEDGDGDGIPDTLDNCLVVNNGAQDDTDSDGAGDLCDADDDNDGVEDGGDNCPRVANDQADLDGDEVGDTCDDDADGDGVVDMDDNCERVNNPDQDDLDQDGEGDGCDVDVDGDGHPNAADNCPRLASADVSDLDHDGLGDACDNDVDGDGFPNRDDNCPTTASASQADADQDGLGDACDNDRDGDGLDNDDDNCPDIANTLQDDFDGDGRGDLCEDDLDGDGVLDGVDNCAFAANLDQADLDQDLVGDACDPDLDGDGVGNIADNCAGVSNPGQNDLNQDGVGDACSLDDDGDTSPDQVDNCPRDPNPDQADLDQDGTGDVCDSDRDGDGVFNAADNCPEVANNDQRDLDQDGLGEACDADRDGDGIADEDDVCPEVADPEQVDFDNDGVGDACEDDQDGDSVLDAEDECPGSGDVAVDPTNGCSIEQLCPCAGPRGTNDEWRTNARYVSCVTQAARRFVKQRLMTAAQQSATVGAAQASDCGYLPCNGRVLTQSPSASGPVLVLEVTAHEPVRQAPSAPVVYAGETRILPDGAGRYRVPFRAANGNLIQDTLLPKDLKSSSLPKGAIVVLRGAAGNYTLGLYGNLPARARLGSTVVARVEGGERANERNQSFERQGDGLWGIGNAGQDEFVSTPAQTTLHMTVGRGNDLLKGRLCQ